MSTSELAQITVPVTWSAETRSASGGLRVKGVAAVYESRSHDLGGFHETLRRGAFREALARPDNDLRLLREHNSEQILARESAGSLKVTETSRGLEFDAEIVPTSYGQDTALLVRTGHLNECSFAFSLPGDGSGEEWSRDGSQRTITQVGRVFELSLCDRGAYGATSVEGRSVEELERTVQAMRARRASGGRMTSNARSFYGPDSVHSYFRDLERRDARRKAENDAQGDPVLRGRVPEELGWGDTGRIDGTYEDCLKRLAVEVRAGSTVLGNLGEFVPQAGSAPTFLADEFVTSVRNASVLPAVMRVEPLTTESGMAVTTPRFGTGSAVSFAPDGAAVYDADPSTSLVNSPLGVFSGLCDVSRQIFERTPGGVLDMWVAGELGAALGEKIDFEILYGSSQPNSPTLNRMLGFTVVPGTNTQTWTQASPTPALFYSQLGKAFSAVSTANGAPFDTVVMHSRRYAWALSQADTTGQPVQPAPLPMKLVSCPQVLTSVNGTQDHVIAFKRDESPLYVKSPQFTTTPMEETLSGTMNVRFQVHQYAALLANRRPTSILVMSGTGLAAAGVTFAA